MTNKLILITSLFLISFNNSYSQVADRLLKPNNSLVDTINPGIVTVSFNPVTMAQPTLNSVNKTLLKWNTSQVRGFRDSIINIGLAQGYIKKADTSSMLFTYLRKSNFNWVNLQGKPNLSLYYLSSNPNGYISSYTETDPTFTSSPSFGISSEMVASWNNTAGYGNWTTQGFLKGVDTISLSNRINLKLSTSNFTWSGLNGKPVFSAVATSGDYIDLVNKPNLSLYYLASNPNGYITSFTESDPTVPSYSKGLTGFSVIKTSCDALYEPIFSKNTAFNRNFGTNVNTITEGNDSRIINGQTAFSWGNHALAGYLTQAYNPTQGMGIKITGSYPNQTIAVDTSEASAGNGAVMYVGKASASIAGLQNGINSKQNTLISGSNIKTVEGQSILGSGNIDLSKTDIGLANVDNTSDLNKPLSTATQTALNGKQEALTLTNTGTSGNATLIGNTLNIPNYSSSTNVGTDSRAGYGTGTPYSLTTSSTKITMGTTNPTVTLPSAGTYMIMSNLKLDYAGLTTVLASTSSFKLRRVNNTASDVPNATTTFTSTIATLLTGPAGDADMQGVLYTTNTSGDVIEMWGNRGANITVGNLNVSEAWIVAIRIY